MRWMLLAALVSSPVVAAPTPQDARLAAISEPVRAARMRAAVQRLVGFGTRHTLSSQTDPKRGIGAALRWTEREMKALGHQTVQTCDTVSGRRVPAPTRVCNVLAIQRGTERPNDVVIITGHIDSRVSDVMDAVKDAPGANDDGSGTAAVMEAATVLARHKFPGTIVYAVLSGEEQGLLGGKILADYARAQGWNVIANLNNDIIGNSCGSDGVCDAKTVRVFSEGPRWQGHEELAAKIRGLGGENDSPSRNISRFLDSLAERIPSIGLDVMQIWRNDRFGRGGDHTELLNAGYPAVRLTVAVENYNQQHQDVRVADNRRFGDTADVMDFPYLAKVAKLNIAALATLASAPPPPEPTVHAGAINTDTEIDWLPGAEREFYVRWRRTDASQWQAQEKVQFYDGPDQGPPNNCYKSNQHPTGECSLILSHIRVDDWVFGVSSVSKDGFESPVASAVPGGAFKPYVAPAAKP